MLAAHSSNMAIVQTVTLDDLEMIAKQLAPLFPQRQSHKSRCGATIGRYLELGALTIALIDIEANI
jgi:hypothetical protein